MSASRVGRRLKRFGRVTKALAGRSGSEFFDDGCPQRAASISYYALFAIVPLALLAVVAFGLVVSRSEAREQVIGFMLDNLPLQPGEGRADLERLLEGTTRNSAAIGVIGVAGLVFSASGIMTAIRHGLNAAFDRRDEGRPPVTGKLFDILLVFGAGLFVVLSLALTIAVELVADLGDEAGGFAAGLGGVLLDLGELLPLALAFGVFLFLYSVVPSGRVSPRDVWPGALVAAVGYELAKTGFGFYLDNFGRYNAIYGSLGAVVAFLVFVFIAANIFLFGGEVASEWRRVRDTPDDELDADGGPSWGERLRGLFVRS